MVESIRGALSTPGAALAVIAIVAAPAAPSLARRAYLALQRISEPAPHAAAGILDDADVAAEFPVRWITLDISSRRDGWRIDENSIEALRDSHADIWLCFTPARPQIPMTAFSGSSVWGLETGAGVPAADHWAGAAEIAAGSLVTTIRLVDYTRPTAPVLYESVGATVLDSVRRTRMQALSKGLTFAKRALARAAPDAARIAPAPQDLAPAGLVDVEPSLMQVAALSARLAAAQLAKRMPSVLSTRQWQVAYCYSDRTPLEVPLAELNYLVPPPDRFWADPFVVEHLNRRFIFMEELLYDTQKGRLVAAEVPESGPVNAPQPVLERPYHLSYPFIFSWEGALYLLPETAGNRTVELYRCQEFPARWTFYKVLLDDIAAFDATLWQQDGRWWMFVNVAQPGASANDELNLYFSASPLGPWRAHPLSPVVTDVRSARPAGPLFTHGSKLYRPSQDCSRAYGHSVVINRIDTLTEHSYCETPVGRLAPDWRRDILRVHTFCASSPLRVLDCFVKVPRWQLRTRSRGMSTLLTHDRS